MALSLNCYEFFAWSAWNNAYKASSVCPSIHQSTYRGGQHGTHCNQGNHGSWGNGWKNSNQSKLNHSIHQKHNHGNQGKSKILEDSNHVIRESSVGKWVNLVT